MSTIKAVYEAIIAHIDDADELRDLAQQLEAEAERRGAKGSAKLSPAAAWPFPTQHNKNDEEEDTGQNSAKSRAKAVWPF